ncbi:MAG: hypothetical protein C4524_12985 [Candidatus Zixiibacteriota bacterium]|nr:MAG: hypothetical protein C4524_12985 [candidate division Zixibacteria bacterium]
MTREGFAAKVRRISWGAIFGGTVLALLTMIILSLLGLAVGLGSINPATGDANLSGFAIGAGIWWVVSSLIALFLGGWAAGRLAGAPQKLDGALHGAVTAGLTVLVMIFLLTSAVGAVIGGAFGLVQTGASLAGQAVGAVAPEVGQAIGQQMQGSDVSLEDIKQEARQILRQTGDPALQPEALGERVDTVTQEMQEQMGQAARQPGTTEQQLDQALERLLSQAGDVISEVDKQDVVNVLMARTNMSRPEAERTVDNWIQTYQQARSQFQQTAQQVGQEAQQVAEQTADVVAQAALWTFIMVLLGTAAAVAGGLIGAPRDMVYAGTAPPPRYRTRVERQHERSTSDERPVHVRRDRMEEAER